MCWTTADSCLSCFKSVNLISLNRQQRALISVYCALVCSVDTADSSQDRFLFCIFSSELQDLEWKFCIVWTESITNDLTVHFQYWNMLPTPPSSSSSSSCCCQFDLYHPCNAIQNVAHALTSIRGHRNLNKNPGLMCPCLTLYVDRVLGHQSFGVRFQCSVCRSSWHLCWTWRGKKRKKMSFTAAEHRVPETKQYSRQGRARSVARKHARLFFVAVRVYFLD